MHLAKQKLLLDIPCSQTFTKDSTTATIRTGEGALIDVYLNEKFVDSYTAPSVFFDNLPNN